MRNALTAVVAGHLCLDIYPDFSGSTPEQFQKSFVPGHLLPIGPLSFSTGGPVSNTGLALHKLGIPIQLMGKVSDDFSGQIIQQLIAVQDPGLGSGMIVDPAANTSYTIVISPPGIDRILLHCPGANDTFSAKDIRYDLLANTDLFHFGYPPLMRRMYDPDGAQLAEIFDRVHTMGVTTSLDMAFPDPASPGGQADWRAILGMTLPYVDIFMPSIEEILLMLHRSKYESLLQEAVGGDILPLITPDLLSQLSRELLEMGAKLVGMKLGYRGLYLRTAGASMLANMGRACPSHPEVWANQELWSTCFVVDVVGTAGSGDATIAGLLCSVLRDLDPGDALTAAVAVGACNVEAADTLSGIRTWEQTLSRISDGWQKRTLELSAPGWQFNEDQQLWVGPAA
jgi:sugar/nucleoside kinase (ribokinase family)